MAAKKAPAGGEAMRAYIYGRYSSHSQKDTSIEQQFAEIREFCDRSGIRIVGEYADRHLTGTNDRRPEFQRLMKDAAKGHVQLVVCWKVDRFARNRYDSAMYKARLKKYGVRVIYAKESIPEGPEGILLESVLEGSAEYYSANLAQNIRRGMHANALECKVNNGRLPLGLCKGPDGRYAIEPAGAAIVREIFAMYIDGMSPTEICADLNARGLRTSRGVPYNKNSLRTILRNERYVGVYKYADVRIEGGIPAIITRETFDMAQEIIAKNARAPAASWSHVDYLLTGRLFCGKCGSAMVGESGTSKTGAKHNYYTCVGRKRRRDCGKKPVKKDWIEELVVRETLQRVLVDSVIERIADAVVDLQRREIEEGDGPILQKQLADVERSIRNVMAAIEQGIITQTTKARLEELEEQRRQLQDQIERISFETPALSKEQVIYWLERFRGGDVTDPAFQWKVIENFVNAVYLYDDRIRIVYNYTKQGAETVDLQFVEGLAEASGEVFGLGASCSTKKKKPLTRLFLFALFDLLSSFFTLLPFSTATFPSEKRRESVALLCKALILLIISYIILKYGGERMESPLLDKSPEFASRVVLFYEDFSKSRKNTTIAKLHISLKETSKSIYWLSLLKRTIVFEYTYDLLLSQAEGIKRMLVASINTAKGNNRG